MHRPLLNILLALLTIATLATDAHARNISDFFLSENCNAMKTLPIQRRADMIAYFEAGQNVTMTNYLDGTDSLISLSNDYLLIATGSISKVEMAMLVSKNDTTLLVITTLKIPQLDSRIEAFNTLWQPIDINKVINTPSIDDFISIPKGSKVKTEDISGQIRFAPISMTYNPDSHTVTATQHLDELLGEELFEPLAPFLLKSISLKIRLKLL